MRIAQLAPLVESVPPAGYGGTELVVSLLTEELVRLGHQVTLFASGDSVTKSKLVSVVPDSLRQSVNGLRHRWPAYDLRSLLKLKEMISDFDVVHNHMGYQALPILNTFKCPVVSTNHNPVADYCADVYAAYANLPYVSISESYRALNYPDLLNYVATIYNGIDVEAMPFEDDSSRKYLLFIGRICRAKGTAVAIDIATRLGLPLKIAGKVDVADKEYFENEVKPKLSSYLIEYLGEVSSDEKAKLYAGAIATVYPIDFDEPFGLVMAESLASGTPVIGLNRGSVKEVVSDGRTGIIASSADEIVKRFDEIRNFKALTCRNRARDLFSKERMVQQYEKLYKRLSLNRGSSLS